MEFSWEAALAFTVPTVRFRSASQRSFAAVAALRAAASTSDLSRRSSSMLAAFFNGGVGELAAVPAIPVLAVVALSEGTVAESSEHNVSWKLILPSAPVHLLTASAWVAASANRVEKTRRVAVVMRVQVF